MKQFTGGSRAETVMGSRATDSSTYKIAPIHGGKNYKQKLALFFFPLIHATGIKCEDELLQLLDKLIYGIKYTDRAMGWLSQLSVCLSSDRDPGVLGSSPQIRLPAQRGACFSPDLSPPCSFSQINKIFLKINKQNTLII